MTTEAMHPDEMNDDLIEVGAAELAWSQAWQLPVLLLGLGLLAIGFYFALPRYSEPDYPGMLAVIEVHLSEDELEQAKDKLDTLAADERFNKSADSPMKGHVAQLYGDLMFRQIDKRVWRGITTATGLDNLDKIAGKYREAEQLGRELPPLALRRYAQTLAAIGDDKGALAIVNRMPVDMKPPRYELVRELIERRVLTDPEPASETLSNLIARFEKELDAERDQIAKRRQQIWVMALKAERLLQAGSGGPDGVVELLVEGGILGLRQRGATPRELAPLTVRLGEAYARLEQFDDARMQLNEALVHLPDGDALIPRIMVAFGDITLAEGQAGQYEQAYNYYHSAYEKDKLGPSSLNAIIGLGHTEANRDGRFQESLDWFKLAVQRVISEEVPAWDVRRKRLMEYLRDVHAHRAFERGRYAEALELLKAYEPLESPDLGARTLELFAKVYQELGNRSKQLAKDLEPDPSTPGVDPNVQARRIHNQDAALAYEKAGNYFRRQAGELTHTTDEHDQALWSAAENYENAQRWDLAVEVYTDFLASSDNAEKLEEASFRVAQALLAEGKHEAAVQRFRAIVEGSPTGELAKRSYVPMAQGLGELGRWDDAERLLRSVVEDHPSIGPESPYYHDALVALGQLYYARGTKDPRFYARAIEVLGEQGGAVERYRRSPQYAREMPTLLYMLADSLRLSARGLIEEAERARTETERQQLITTRKERLGDAQMYYNQVLYEMKDWHPDSFSQLELQYFRNAHFYEADCAFDRGDFETAINLYLNAVRRWQDHPVALMGWVQIMNAWAELGNYEKARAAHTQALELFNQMPEGAFQRADSLMTRERWDDWLQWMTQLDLFGPGATAGVDTPD